MYHNDEYFIKHYNPSVFISLIDKKIINKYLYYDIINVNKIFIGAIIGKKGITIKAIIQKVKSLTFDKNFEYYINKNMSDDDNMPIYILANNNITLRIATEQLHCNIQKYLL